MVPGRFPSIIFLIVLYTLRFCRVVPISEASVVIAISSVHRKDSLEAVQYCIDTLKATVPIWKKVHLFQNEMYSIYYTSNLNCPITVITLYHVSMWFKEICARYNVRWLGPWTTTATRDNHARQSRETATRDNHARQSRETTTRDNHALAQNSGKSYFLSLSKYFSV